MKLNSIEIEMNKRDGPPTENSWMAVAPDVCALLVECGPAVLGRFICVLARRIPCWFLRFGSRGIH